MIEEKWNNMYCLVVFDKFTKDNREFVDVGGAGYSQWSIYLKSRSNVHPNEPSMKMMVMKDGQEVAKYTDSFQRGYGHYEEREDMIPGTVRKACKKIWKDLEKGKYTDDVLKAIRDEFIKKYEAREERAEQELADLAV